jgi:hypothetical protein
VIFHLSGILSVLASHLLSSVNVNVRVLRSPSRPIAGFEIISDRPDLPVTWPSERILSALDETLYP